MALSIKDPETEALARKLAAHRGTTITGAIRQALAEVVANDDGLRAAEVERRRKAIEDIQARVRKLPKLMTAEEADDWMYDENGLPH